MVGMVAETPRPYDRRTLSRALVHLGLIGAAVVSLAFEPVLSIHIGVGLLFIGFVGAHLAQRREVSTRLLSGLIKHRSCRRRTTRTAVADIVLLSVCVFVLGSGVWDWLLGPTRLRWHAISGVVMAGLIVSHTLRRGRRVLTSRIR